MVYDDIKQLKKRCKQARLSDAAIDGILDRTFRPSKACTVNLIIALRLDFKSATELLEAANIEWCDYNKFDVAIDFFLKNGIYESETINAALYLLDLPTLRHCDRYYA